MNWKPNTDSHTRKQRAQMLHNIRAFFYERDVLEVETPALSKSANTDPYIESFELPLGLTNSRFLHTSPEYPMKRLLAADSGDIYQMAKVWRSGECGSNHNPEFTMLEWYRLGFSYQALIQEVDTLLTGLMSPTNKLQQPALIISYQQLFLEKLNFNPHTVSLTDLIACCDSNIDGLDTKDLDHQDMLDALLTHCIEPEFTVNRLTFIFDYPASQSALAAVRVCNDVNKEGNDHYSVAERFEVYLGPLELGNGYQEETSYQRNSEILNQENDTRINKRLKKMPVDSLFLDAVEAGIPRCSGVAIGLDRVLMGILNKKAIKEVINFTWVNA